MKYKIHSIIKKTALYLGFVALSLAIPFAGYAATDSASTTITANIASVISMTTSGTVAINVTPTAGGSQSNASDTVSVSTNNTAGYNLTLSNADTNTALVSGGNTILAHTGTQASPTALANDRWGYRVVGVGGFGAGATTQITNAASNALTYAGVPSSASPNTLKSTSSTATNDITTIWYSVKSTTAQPNGTYSDIVTYTATTN